MESRLMKKFQNLEESSHLFFAKVFVKMCKKMDKLNYIYSDKLGWLEYNKYNVIHITSEPLKLNLDISKVLSNYLKKMLSKLNPSDKDFDHYTKVYRRAHINIEHNTFKKKVINELKSLLLVRNIDEKLDSNQKLLAFTNKVYDFNLLAFRDIEKSDFISLTTGYKLPKENQKVQKELKQIVHSIFENEDMENYILDTFGYALFTNSFEIMHILSGKGGNGKGLITELLLHSLGGYYYTPDSKFLTCKYRAQVANPDLYNCRGKRVCMITEPESENDEVKFNIEFIKKVTGNDVVTCRDMYKSNITYNPKFTIFVQCNEKPALDKMESAIKRRIKCCEFPFNFVPNPKHDFERKVDYTLKQKMSNKKYYTQFMMLLINHIKDKVNQKIVFPKQVEKETNEYFESENQVLSFINARLDITNDPKDRIKCSELYQIFKRDQNFEYMSNRVFKYNMLQNNIKQKPYLGYNSWYGLKLKNIIESDTEEDDFIDDLDRGISQCLTL